MELVTLGVLLLVALIVGVPSALERRGQLWKSLAEEREAKIVALRVERDDARAERDSLALRPDMSALAESLTTHENRAASRDERAEDRALERHEKLIASLDALTDKIDNLGNGKEHH